MSESLPIRPYARLITMLGDQLIKNETIALIEIIKNSYDADASWVKVSFVDFNENGSINKNSKIIIEDDGCGMDEFILKKHWLNPATPDKLKRKNETTPKGRILQGEKGIGRFAVFKLGKNIKVITRRENQDIENQLTYNFSGYDDNFLSENGQEKELYLDDLTVSFEKGKPQFIVGKKVELGSIIKQRKPHGTIIEICDLKSNWTSARISKVQNEIGKMQPIFSDDDNSDFNVWIYMNGNIHISQEKYKEKLKSCLNYKSVFKITEGKFTSATNSIKFLLNGNLTELNFNSPEINGLKQFKEYFKHLNYKTECGDFGFEFYVFDFNINTENDSRYMLDSEEKKIIKEHRIYLYRDHVRVMPYGDPDDDWLKVDMTRGTVSAAEFLSNDQVVGCVYISQSGNPQLKDKTNREGLIENGQALGDFINILQLILKYIRKEPFAKYLINKKRKTEIEQLKNGKPLSLIENAKKKYKDNTDVQKFLCDFEKSYKKEYSTLNERIKKTENLAAVGLSIETASHDVMLFLGKTIELQDAIIKDLMVGEEINHDELMSRLTLIRGNLSMVQTQMKDIQLLFPSTKSRTKNINVKSILEKVHGLYKRPFNKYNIDFSVQCTKNPLIVKTTDAVLLQVLINLFDNALYWLQTTMKERKIIVLLDGNEQRLIFSDNGPGIKDDDKNYIFEAFYSGKGEEGRGLGLYIARQLLERYDYTIELAEFSKDKLLKGANFVIEFSTEG